MAAGWKHIYAPNTIIFKRRQDMSLVIELGQRQTLLWELEIMAINQISAIGNSQRKEKRDIHKAFGSCDDDQLPC